jgi:hypothetical protein
VKYHTRPAGTYTGAGPDPVHALHARRSKAIAGASRPQPHRCTYVRAPTDTEYVSVWRRRLAGAQQQQTSAHGRPRWVGNVIGPTTTMVRGTGTSARGVASDGRRGDRARDVRGGRANIISCQPGRSVRESPRNARWWWCFVVSASSPRRRSGPTAVRHSGAPESNRSGRRARRVQGIPCRGAGSRARLPLRPAAAVEGNLGFV